MDSGICGGDWDRFEETMTFTRLNALNDAWERVPPLTLVTAWRFKLGKQPRGRQKGEMPDMPNLAALMAHTGQNIGG
jgi:hypothetical protein